MSATKKILIAILIVILITIIAGIVLYKLWSRPDRLDAGECRKIVLLARELTQKGTPSGTRIFQFRLGRRIFRERAALSTPINFTVSERFFERLFESENEFFDNIKLRHMGRLLVARRICERVSLSPAHYKGDSIELWVDSESGYLLGHCRYDACGKFLRGYRYKSVTGLSERESEGSTDSPISFPLLGKPFLDGQLLIEPDKVMEYSERHVIALPEYLPAGFELVGTRISAMELPGRRDRGPIRPHGPMLAQCLTIYSDGLNTISIIQIPIVPFFIESQVDPDRIEEVLGLKAGQVHEIFHTSMAWRMLPNGLIMLFGEVSQNVINEVAAGIPEQPLEPARELMPPVPVPPEDLPRFLEPGPRFDQRGRSFFDEPNNSADPG